MEKTCRGQKSCPLTTLTTLASISKRRTTKSSVDPSFGEVDDLGCFFIFMDTIVRSLCVDLLRWKK
jgi:hypothetical protein